MLRRHLLIVTALAPLAACNQTPAQIAATLQNAQAEASAIFTAVKAFVPANASSAITTALSAAQTAITAFVGAVSGPNAIVDAETAINDLTPLLSLLPIASTTLADIKLGLALVQAFASGLPSVAAPAPSALVGAAPMTVIQAPIPIRVPLS